MLQIIIWQLSALIAIGSFHSKNPNNRLVGCIIAAVFIFMSLGQASTFPSF